MTTSARAVLFDLDGVLVNSLPVVERAWRRWAADLGLVPEQVLAAIHGRRGSDVVRMFAPDLDTAEQARRVNDYELDDAGLLAEIPGARECLAGLETGRWAIVTSGPRSLATRRLTVVGLPFPAAMVTGDEVVNGKPDPEPYLRGAEVLGVAPGECVVVEDAPAGVLAGKAAGMTVLAVPTTHPAGDLGDADLVLGGMDEVIQYLHAAEVAR